MRIPDRLYFDKILIPVRDDIKEYRSKINESPKAALTHLVRQLIEYVESADYVELDRVLNTD